MVTPSQNGCTVPPRLHRLRRGSHRGNSHALTILFLLEPSCVPDYCHLLIFFPAVELRFAVRFQRRTVLKPPRAMHPLCGWFLHHFSSPPGSQIPSLVVPRAIGFAAQVKNHSNLSAPFPPGTGPGPRSCHGRRFHGTSRRPSPSGSTIPLLTHSDLAVPLPPYPPILAA